MKTLIALLFALILLPGSAQARYHLGAEAGTTTPLVGVNVAGLNIAFQIDGVTHWIVPCPSTTGIDPECQYYHNKNLNMIRIPFAWESMQLALGGPLNAVYVANLQNIVRQAGLLGMKAILDCHNFGGYNGLNIGAPGGPTYAQFADLWIKLATVFNGMSGLGGYDIMNEPANMPTAQAWPLAAQAAIDGIRTVDTTAPIYVEGDAFASAFGWLNDCANCGGWGNSPLGNGGNNDLLGLIDPSNKIVYSAHSYADSNSSGTYPVYPTDPSCAPGDDSYQCAVTLGDVLTTPTSAINTNIYTKRYTPFVNWCKANNKTCWLGESGVPYDSANWQTTMDNGVGYLQDNNILFTYWGAGPVFSCRNPPSDCSYRLGTYPNGLGTSTVIDTIPQAVLDKRANAYQSPNYTVTGPTRGTASVASSNFTLTYNSYIRRDIHFTLSDGGAGGTFTPSSITCATGFNCSQTFTYTPPGTAVYTLSFTNDAGVTNPSPLGFATISDLFLSSGASPVNILAMRKIFAPYIGNALQLRKGSDLTESNPQNFGFTSTALYAPLDIAGIIAWNGAREIDTIQSTSIIVQQSTSYGSDAGVTYYPSGTALTYTNGAPSVGQYSVYGSGHYVFNSADIGQQVTIKYLFPTYVVTYYDQSGNGFNAGHAAQDGAYPVPSLANEPQFTLNCQNGQPCLYFNGTNYMDLYSPLGIGGTQTEQSVLSVFQPTPYGNINQGPVVDWSWAGQNNQNFWYNEVNCCGWGNSYASAVNSETNVVRTYSQDAVWHATASTYKASASDGSRSFLDGRLVERVTSSAQVFSLPYGRTNATMGYSRFFSPNNTFKGYLGELIVLNNQITNSDVSAIQANQLSAWNVSSFAGWSIYSPTLDQSTIAANALPWYGVNETDSLNGNTTIRTGVPAYYASRGMNISRVPYNWEKMQTTIGATLDPTYLATIDADVAALNAAGIDALLDLHNDACYNGHPIDTTGAPTTAQFAAFYTQMANHYKTNPKVYLDVMNEPVCVSGISTWAAMVQAAITAVRAAGFNNYFFVEMNNGYASCSGGDGAAGTAFLAFTDTQNKLVYECHNYFDSNNGGYLPTAAYGVQGAAAADLTSITAWAVANNVKLFLGESGLGFTTSMYAEMKVAYDIMKNNQATTLIGGWAGSTSWGGGSTFVPGNFWGNGYFFAMEPQIIDGSTVDKPVMRFLNSYWTGHTWPAAGGAWPYNVQFP